MNYQPDQWKKCRNCGAHYPAAWARCGRCGQMAPVNGGFVWSIRLIVLALLLVIGYSYRDMLVAFFNDSVRISHMTAQNADDGTDTPSTQSEAAEEKPNQNSDNDPISMGEASESSTSSTPQPSESAAATPEPASTQPIESSATPGPVQKHETVTTPSPSVSPASVPPAASAVTTQSTAKEVSDEVLYQRIHEALQSVSESVMLPRAAPSETVFGMIHRIVQDDPLILFYEGCSYRSDGLLTLKYSKPKDFILKARDEVTKKAGQIVADIIKPGMTDFEKELAIHDYIVDHCAYDRENLLEGTLPPESHSVYGVLVLKTAVCEGYAKAFKLLLDLSNIESRVINGKSMGQLHAWNLVKIEGDWYHVDATWDDPVMKDGSHIRQYTYFNLTDAQIASDHDWDKKAYPACQKAKYNYFLYTGNQVSSPDEFLKALIKKAEEGNNPITLKITDYTAERYNIPDLIQKAIYLLDANAAYSVNEKYGVVQVWLEGKD